MKAAVFSVVLLCVLVGISFAAEGLARGWGDGILLFNLFILIYFIHFIRF